MIAFACPQCRQPLQVPETAAGKRVRCPKCQQACPVPAAPPPPPEDVADVLPAGPPDNPFAGLGGPAPVAPGAPGAEGNPFASLGTNSFSGGADPLVEHVPAGEMSMKELYALLSPAARSLGVPLRVFRVQSKGSPAASVVVVLGLLVLATFIGGMMILKTGPIMGCFVAPFYLVFCAYCVAVILREIKRMGKRWVMLFPNGFVHVQGDQETLFPWEDVAAVHVKKVYAGADTDTVARATVMFGLLGALVTAAAAAATSRAGGVQVHTIRLRHKDGTRLEYTENPSSSDVMQNAGALAEAVNEGVARVQHAPHLQRLKAGESLKFGPVFITPDGIGDGKKSLPRPELDSVEAADGKLIVRQNGTDRPWASFPSARIPNFLLFRNLLEAAHGIRIY